MLSKEQDQGLVELEKAVERVGGLANAMNEELNLQGRCATSRHRPALMVIWV